MEKLQIWNNVADVLNYKMKSIDSVVAEIIANDYLSEFLSLRLWANRAYNTNNKEATQKYDIAKNKLPLITVSATMKDKRRTENIIHYNGLIVLDLDIKEYSLLKSRFEALKREVSQDFYTFLCFNSPRGKGLGLKVVVRVFLNERIEKINSELKNKDLSFEQREMLIEELKDFHQTAYKSIKEYYETKYEIVLDNNAKSILGSCFLSADKDIVHNENSSLFKVIWAYCPAAQVNYTETKVNITNTESSKTAVLEAILKDFTKNCNGRNTATFYISMQAKHYDINEDEILNFVMQKWGDVDFTEKEARRAIRNGFKYTPYVQYEFRQINNI